VIEQHPAELQARDGARFPATLHCDSRHERHTAFVMMHPSSDWQRQFLLPLLAERGFGALGCANRYAQREAELLLEDTLLDWAACVDHLRAAGYRKIVGIGYSGGGEIAAGYQSESVAPSIKGSPGATTPDLTALGLTPMDGLVMFNAHAGRPHSVTLALDPSVGGESGNDPLQYDASLDMFNPANGPPYSDDFRRRYRAAQVERNHKITRWCETELARITTTGNPLLHDFPVIIHRTDANLSFLDRPAGETRRESTRWGLAAHVANYTPGPLRGNNTRLMVVTLRSWLSQRSLARSQFDVLRFLPQCKVPTLVIWGTADAAGSAQSKKIFETSPDPQKKFVSIEGATHFLRDQPGHQAAVADQIAAWATERGFTSTKLIP
jgi:pimeloyl-ACP methyl ester carboxylesterase